MATQTRNPTSDIAVTGTVSGSAGSRWTLVDDYPDAAGTDALTFGTTAATIVFGYSAFTVPAGSTDLSVQVLYYDGEAANGANNCAGRLRVGGTNFNASTHNPSGASYSSRTDNFATNPQTGAAWTVDQVNGTGANPLQGFGIHSTDSNPQFRVSSVQLQATYTAPSSSGSGSSAAAPATSGGTGTVGVSGSGATVAPRSESSGSGTVEEGATDVTGSGASTAAPAVSSGTGTVRTLGTGAATGGAGVASGTGAVRVSSSGAASSAPTVSSGAGTVAIAGSGASVAAAATSSGTGQDDGGEAGGDGDDCVNCRAEIRSGLRSGLRRWNL